MAGEFEGAVAEAIRSLRPGELATYGEIAEEAGHPGAGRAVGNVLARSDGLPWWRVVGAGARLVSVHASSQADRLRSEGWDVVGLQVRGRAVPGLPPSVTVRPASMDDVDDLTRLVAASERADLGVVETGRDDVHADWSRPGFDPGRDGVVLRARGRMVAAAEVYRARRAQVVVHPRSRGTGIGAALLAWTERLATDQGGTKVGQTVADRTPGAARLFEANGYRPLWTSWILSIDLREPLPTPKLPRGMAVRDFEPGDAEAVHALIEAAFGEWPERDPTTFEDWAAVTLQHPSFRPELLPVVVSGARIVGIALCLDHGGEEGWVQQLAVAAPARGRGIGRALLGHAFEMFRRGGRVRCEVSTDSRTGALGLYERLGMRVTRSYTHWAKDLGRRGAEPARLS